MVKKWLFRIGARKAIGKIVMVTAAFLTSAQVAPVLTDLGLTIDVEALQTGMTAALFGGLEMLRNFLKVKYGVNIL